MPQINCIKLVAEFLSAASPGLPLLTGVGFSFLPLLILFSFPPVAL